MIKNKVNNHEFVNLYPRLYPNKKVKNVTFIVTHQCNLRCTYCYEGHKTDEKMSLDVAKKCVDFLFEEDAKNSKFINDYDAHGIILEFIGGEPLLEIELITDTVHYFLDKAIKLNHRWKNNYGIGISTNGVLGDNPKVQQFLKEFEGRLFVGVTIDGDKEAHDACRKDCNGCGSYDKAIKMFRQVTTSNGRRSTKYTIAPGNLTIFSRSIKHLIEEEQCNIIHCNCVYEKGWTLDHAKELYKQLKEVSDYVIDKDIDVHVSILDWEAGSPLPDTETQNWCGGNGRMLAFEVDGSILPCLRYSSISIPLDEQPLYKIGDIYNGFASCLEEKNRIKELDSITRQSQSEQKCLDCPIAEGCGWCTAYNYQMTGTPNKRVTYICDMHKARVLAQCYYCNKLFLKYPNLKKPKHCNVPKEWALEIISEDEWDMLMDLERKCFEKEKNKNEN